MKKVKRSMARVLTVVTERERVLMPQLGIYRWEEVWRKRGRPVKDWFRNKYPKVPFPPPIPGENRIIAKENKNTENSNKILNNDNKNNNFDRKSKFQFKSSPKQKKKVGKKGLRKIHTNMIQIKRKKKQIQIQIQIQIQQQIQIEMKHQVQFQIIPLQMPLFKMTQMLQSLSVFQK